MAHDESLELETDRLQMREVVADDVELLHQVFESNQDFLAFREDIASAPGGYDLASVERYWEMARLDPNRHLLMVEDKATGASVGLVDLVSRSPADGLPWIGLVMTHRSYQRRGVASEAMGAVTAHLATQGHPAVRMAVIEGNEVGLSFARRVGFEGY